MASGATVLNVEEIQSMTMEQLRDTLVEIVKNVTKPAPVER